MSDQLSNDDLTIYPGDEFDVIEVTAAQFIAEETAMVFRRQWFNTTGRKSVLLNGRYRATLCRPSDEEIR